MPEITTAEIAERAHGEITGDPTLRITAVASLEAAQAHELSFVSNARYAARAPSTRAGAVLIPRSLPCDLPEGVTGIRVDDPYVVLAWLLPLLYPDPPLEPGIHPTAIVPPDAEIGPGVRIEPYVVLGKGVRIGRGTRVGSHSAIGDRCSVGADTTIHPHVTLHPGVFVGDRCVIHSGARLGESGFAVATSADGVISVPTAGDCRIGNDVEIGANTTVDRGLASATSIGNGTKIDNLVQVGHGARVGNHVLLVAQVGVSEGVVVEDGAILGGQAGVAEHLTVGRGARVAGKSGVIGNIPPGETVSGYPARPHREAMRAQAALFRLPAMFKKLQELERVLRRSDPDRRRD